MMKGMGAVFRRELLSYATTPGAYVFVAVFLFAANLFAFQVGGLWDARQADLSRFFAFHPWIFMIFLPAVAMRLWSEDIQSGAIELLMTLPVTTPALVLGKFFAAWVVAAAALLLTTPLWITMNILGDPDNLAIFAGYVASLMMAGGYLAIGSAMSAMASSQVAAFVLGVLISFVFTAIGLPLVLDTISGVLGGGVSEMVSSLSVMRHVEAAQRGVIELRAVFFFVSLMALFLSWTALAVDARRGG
jgi:ABC-2 type transport system permease protein